MPATKGKKAKIRPAENEVETRQFVVTLNVAKGRVLKVEALEPPSWSDEHPFAELAKTDEDLESAIVEAYAAGVGDALDESAVDEFDEHDGDEIRNTILRGAAARQLLRRGVRKLILRRALQRSLARKSEQTRKHAGELSGASHRLK